MAGDGIHYDATGHRIVATAIWKAWKLKPENPVGTDADTPASSCDPAPRGEAAEADAACVALACGPPATGIEAGLPLAEAEAQAAELRVEIRKRLSER